MGAAQRLEMLRTQMIAAGVDFYLVPSSDAHQSEYLPAAWQRRAWLTGFTGSMGSAVVGRGGAWLWADSRYWLQAEAELDSAAWSLMRLGEHDVPTIARFLERQPAGTSVGYDARLSSPAEARELLDAVQAAGGRVVAIDENLVDRVWTDRPALPATPVTVWPEAHAGQSVADKLAAIRGGVTALGGSALVATTLDEIAWIFNLRGADVAFNPVFVAWAIIEASATTLYVNPAKLGPEAAAHLAAASVRVAAYEAFGEGLDALSDQRVIVDKGDANQWIMTRLEHTGARPHMTRSPVQLLRAKKNAVEADGMRRAHVRDAVAVVRFLAWLETGWRAPQADGTPLDELGVAARLEAFRREGEHFRGLSFDTIAGFGPNGAIVHYRASPATSRAIGDTTLFLLDSGAQYLDGTTDITRTLHLGTPTDTEREHYTRVLRGHLGLGRTSFPRGTTGTQLDAFARAPLWEVGLNYGHGTGHGVGCYLSVHQGPHRISPALNDVPLEPGMIVSNEPGLYLAGAYGIRIENLVLVVTTRDATPYGPFFGFEDLTLVPYCRRLIEPSLLNSDEQGQVDAYHARVRATLEPLVPADVVPWLARETAPLERI